MVFSNNRDDIRQHYYLVWQKQRNGQSLDALEQLICNIINLHPEYHGMLENKDNVGKDYTPEMGQTNPFLHMGMHIALHEQLSTQRPAGINAVYEKLVKKLGDQHEAEHQMMECLGEALWKAQRNNTMPDESAYLNCLKKL